MTKQRRSVGACLLLVVSLAGCGKKAPVPDEVAQASKPQQPADVASEIDDDLKDITNDLAKTKKDLSNAALSIAKNTVEETAVSDLERRLEKWQELVADAFDGWEQDDQLKTIRDNTGHPEARKAHRTNEEQLRKQRDALTRNGADRLRNARQAVKAKLKNVRDNDGLARVEKGDLKAVREGFQKQLDADLTSFKADITAARRRVLASAKGAAKDAQAQQLTDDVLKRIRQLKEDAATCPVVWDRNTELRPDTRITRIYLTKLHRANLVKDLAQQDLIKVIDASLKTNDVFLHKSALELCGSIDDTVVFARLGTKEAMRSPEFRRVVLGRLPSLFMAGGSNPALLEALANSYLADPQPSHAADFDKVVKQIDDSKLRKSKEFVWFLAAAAWSGSKEAERQVFELYTSEEREFQKVSYLYDAARKERFNYLVGAIVARRAGKDAPAVFRRCVSTIVPGVHEERLLALRDFTAIRGVRELNDFINGWFAAVDPSFAAEALRIYKLLFDDPERRKLKGLENLLGGFEAFRLGAINMALRTPDGLPVEFLYQVNKLYWQSERVVSLTALKDSGRLAKVEVPALKGMVDDPWAGTARYSPKMLTRAGQQIRINEWILYASALEERSKDDAVDAYRRAFLGQTAIRKSLQGEDAMYPYRIHALRRLLALKPDAFPEVVEYAATEKCPGTLRRAVLCVYAADHARIGKGYIDKIPVSMPRDGLSALSSAYVDGMLMAFAVVRDGKEPTAVKSADEDAVRGYTDVLLSHRKSELVKVALAALKYKSIRPSPPQADVGVASDGSEFTPFHFMDPTSVLEAVKPIKADTSTERVADDYAKWRDKVWPGLGEAMPKTAEEARKEFVAAHRLLEFRPERASSAERLKEFESDPSIIHARGITNDWPLYEPDVVHQALKILTSGESAIDNVGNMVWSLATGAPSSARGLEKAPNACVLIQQRAEVLEGVFTSLQAFESGVTELNDRRRVQIQIVQPILKFLDTGPDTIRKCREAAR